MKRIRAVTFCCVRVVFFCISVKVRKSEQKLDHVILWRVSEGR
jgi:hypothetical protein